MNLQNAIIDWVKTMKDGSLKITLVTRALDPKTMAEIFYSLNSEVLQIDIPEDSADEKSPSQRLRNTLYILWEQKHRDKYATFATFYPHYMELLINSVKDKLEPNK